MVRYLRITRVHSNTCSITGDHNKWDQMLVKIAKYIYFCVYSFSRSFLMKNIVIHSCMFPRNTGSVSYSTVYHWYFLCDLLFLVYQVLIKITEDRDKLPYLNIQKMCFRLRILVQYFAAFQCTVSIFFLESNGFTAGKKSQAYSRHPGAKSVGVTYWKVKALSFPMMLLMGGCRLYATSRSFDGILDVTPHVGVWCTSWAAQKKVGLG